MRNPQRTASTAAALMIGLALVTLVATLAAGITQTFRGAVNDIFVADYAITAQNNYSPIPTSVVAQEAGPEQPRFPDAVRLKDGRIVVVYHYATAHTNANGKGTDCHPQHESIKRRVLRRALYFRADCCGPFARLIAQPAL